MERTKQKSKKEKPNKYVDKEKSTSFVTDVKTLKENLKIREILRTVKMNSSMRIKAPRGSKVMQNKDFHENEDIFEDAGNEDQDVSDPPSATNPLVVNNNVDFSDKSENNCVQDEFDSAPSDSNVSKEDVSEDPGSLHKSYSLSERLDDSAIDSQSTPNILQVPQILPSPLESPLLRSRDRKLSLDHTMLSKRESLSQSEVDLHSIGKSPLERKSSFFRKKMDSFLKNTTEIFKKQSLGSKSSIQRRGSTCSRMSVSMQSLNENEPYIEERDREALDKYNREVRGSVSSLRSAATPVLSNSSLSVTQSDRLMPDYSEEDSLAGSRHGLVGSQPLGDGSTTSINNLNDSFAQESLLNSRAISMSSGLDTAVSPRRRKASRSNRSNRVTWLASESLTDYFRRLIQDEKTKELQVCHSYQDFSTIPENTWFGTKTDNKGRRLSYQRAVSGEDPVLPSRYQDSNLRKKKIPETPEGSSELANCLARYAQNGVPRLVGFEMLQIPEEAFAYLEWAGNETNLEEHYDWSSLSSKEESRQAVIKEFIHTEADYIRHLITIIELYIAAAHALQDLSILLELDTSLLFLNIPDVLNASIMFWEKAVYPMIQASIANHTPFNTDLMAPGFDDFPKIFLPYEFYMCHQTMAVDYLRSLSTNTEFMTYLTWCNNQNSTTRLQLGDILVKPMQRLTKYSILLQRITAYTESAESKLVLENMIKTTNSFVQGVNRAIRKKQELDKLDELDRMIEPYDVDCKDEEMEKYFRELNETDVKCPMTNCNPNLTRNIIHSADMRFKEFNMKEIEVRAIILTDMMLICKKVVRGNGFAYKMIRPKYTVERLVMYARTVNKGSEMNGIIFISLDDHNTATSVFCLSEMPKDPDPQQTYRIFEDKMHEAKISYDLSVWFHKYPVKDLAEVEADYYSEEFRVEYAYNLLIEKKARERTAAMMHPYIYKPPEPGPDLPDDFEPGRGPPSLLDYLTRPSLASTLRTSRGSSLHNTQSTSSRNSRMSSFQQSSATSHEDPSHGDTLKHLYRAGSSFEQITLSLNHDRAAPLTRSSTNISGTKSDTSTREAPVLVLEQSSPHRSLEPRSASTGGSKNTLSVSPQHSMAIGHSMPDLTIESNSPNEPLPVPLTASEKLYQSHQELLQKNRLAAGHYHQYLTPDQRGSSYPPPTKRASLKRGLALSYSCKNPPLTKMGHVNSQTTMQSDQITSTQIKVPQDIIPETSSINIETEKQELRMYNRSRSKSPRVPSPEPSKADKAGPSTSGTSKPDDDDKSRTSQKSAKGKSDKGSKVKGDKSG